MGSGASKARAAQNEALLEAGTKASLSTAPNSEAQWYWSSADQKQHGPCTIAELQAIVATGGAAAPALVWRPGWERWTSASMIPELSVTGHSSPSAASSRAGGGGAETTYSWAYVPFLHAVIGTDDASMAECAARLDARDEQFDVLIQAYRHRLQQVAPEVLQPGHVADTNRASGMCRPWPYIPAAPPCDEPRDPSKQSWPMRSFASPNGDAGGGVGVDGGAGVGGSGIGGYYTQEGLLSEQPVLFARLQEMVRRLEEKVRVDDRVAL